jgi:PAS domain-containing protein
MAIDNRSREELLAELETLRLRLEETEDTLQAICSGEVDALVVSSPEGEQVFTLKGAEHPYRVLVESMSEGAAFLAPDGMILYGNRQLADMLQVPMERIIGSMLVDYVTSQDQSLVAGRLVNPNLEGDRVEITLKTGTGNNLAVLFSCSNVDIESAPRMSVVLTDISIRKHAEEKILRLNRLYAMSNAIDLLIVHSKDRNTLFREFCRIAVELGGFRLAWIGVLNPDAGLVTVLTAAGETGFLEGLRVTIKGEPDGKGPAGSAIRTGTYCLYNDFLGAESTGPLHEKARIHGLLASASVAIKENNVVIGALSLYVGEKDYFDDQQIQLLQQMGADISFALDNLAQESKLREARKQIGRAHV